MLTGFMSHTMMFPRRVEERCDVLGEERAGFEGVDPQEMRIDRNETEHNDIGREDGFAGSEYARPSRRD